MTNSSTPEETPASVPTTISNQAMPKPFVFVGNSSVPFVLEGYEMLGPSWQGGMGVVYKARHVGSQKTVALKMIRAGDLAGPDHLGRFRTEIEAVRRLRHPQVAG